MIDRVAPSDSAHFLKLQSWRRFWWRFPIYSLLSSHFYEILQRQLTEIYSYYNTVFCCGCGCVRGKGSQSLGRENVKSVGKNPFQVQGLLDAKIGRVGWGGGREGGRRDSNASEKYIQVIKKCVQLVHCNELTMIIKKTVTLPSVHNNGTLRNNNNDAKILHAVQNWWPCPSSDSSIISYSSTSKVPDQANPFLEKWYKLAVLFILNSKCMMSNLYGATFISTMNSLFGSFKSSAEFPVNAIK